MGNPAIDTTMPSFQILFGKDPGGWDSWDGWDCRDSSTNKQIEAKSE